MSTHGQLPIIREGYEEDYHDTLSARTTFTHDAGSVFGRRSAQSTPSPSTELVLSRGQELTIRAFGTLTLRLIPSAQGQQCIDAVLSTRYKTQEFLSEADTLYLAHALHITEDTLPATREHADLIARLLIERSPGAIGDRFDVCYGFKIKSDDPGYVSTDRTLHLAMRERSVWDAVDEGLTGKDSISVSSMIHSGTLIWGDLCDELEGTLKRRWQEAYQGWTGYDGSNLAIDAAWSVEIGEE